jgi:hypothetical protein
MPEGAAVGMPHSLYCRHACVMESGTLSRTTVPILWRFGRHEADTGLPGVPPLASVQHEGSPECGVPPRASGCSPRRGDSLSSRKGRHGSQGAPRAGSSRRIPGDAVHAVRGDSLRTMRISGSTRVGVRSSGRRWASASPIPAVRQRVLPSPWGNERRGTSSVAPGSLRQLQLDKASRARGMAVAICQ